MSAFMCSNNTISAVCQILVEYGSGKMDDTLYNDIYANLHHENQRSLNALYSDPIDANITDRYIPLDNLDPKCERKNLSIHDKLATLIHYHYQACEHEEFSKTDVGIALARVCDALKEEGANHDLAVITWGLNSNPDAHHDTLIPVVDVIFNCPDEYRNHSQSSDAAYIARLLRKQISLLGLNGKVSLYRGSLTCEIQDGSIYKESVLRQFANQFKDGDFTSLGVSDIDLNNRKLRHLKEGYPTVTRLYIHNSFSDHMLSTLWDFIHNYYNDFLDSPATWEEAILYHTHNYDKDRKHINQIRSDLDAMLREEYWWEHMARAEHIEKYLPVPLNSLPFKNDDYARSLIQTYSFPLPDVGAYEVRMAVDIHRNAQ